MVPQSFFFLFNVLALMDGDDNEGGAAASLALIFCYGILQTLPDAAAARRCSATQWARCAQAFQLVIVAPSPCAALFTISHCRRAC